MIELSLDLNKSIKSFQNRITLRQGDIGEKVLISIYDNKKPVDLTEQHKVKLEGNLRNSDYVEGEANPYNSEKGKYVFQFQSKDVSIIGKYQRAFLRVYDENDNRISSEEVHIEVLKDADISQSQATTYVSKLDDLLENMDQEFESFMDEKEIDYGKLDQKCNELGSELTSIQIESTGIKKTQSDILQSIKDNKLATKTELENAKQESSANVINQIGGAESAVLKKELLVNGIEGMASRYVKDISANENLLGVFKNTRWKLDSKTGRIVIEGASSGSILSEVTLPAGTYTVSFKVFQKPTTSTSFSFYVDGAVENSGALSNFNGFNEGALVTKKVTLTKESVVRYTLWGNASFDTISFELKLEKGDYSKYSPAPEWLGIVHGQPNLLNGTSNQWEELTVNSWQHDMNYLSLSELGLKVGDMMSVTSEIDNISGETSALMYVVFRDSTKTAIQAIYTDRIPVGSMGISKGELVIPEGTVYISWAKCARPTNPTTPNVVKVRNQKLIKGSLAAMDEWTPSQADSGLTPVNNGMVPFTDDEYATLLSEDGVVRSETKMVGCGAGIEFLFDVIGTLENKYPFLFENLTTTSEKITKYKKMVQKVQMTLSTRGGGLINGIASNYSRLYIANSANDTWWGSGSFIFKGSTLNSRTEQVSNTFANQVNSEGKYIYRVASKLNGIDDNGAISDGVTSAWVEVKDIRLTVELEVNGRTIIEEMIAANHVENLATQLEAETGTDNAKTMTPLRTAQQINKKAVTIAGNQTIGGIKNFKDGLMINDDLVVSKNDHSVFILDSTTSSVIAEGKLCFILHGSLVVVEGSIKFKTDVAYVAMISSSLPDSMIATINNATLVGHIGNNSAKGIFVEKGTKNIKANSVFVAGEWFTCNGVYWAGKE